MSGPHSHVTCGGCNTLLMYPQVMLGKLRHACSCASRCYVSQRCIDWLLWFDLQQGASQVRCSRCGHLTQVPQSQGVLSEPWVAASSSRQRMPLAFCCFAAERGSPAARLVTACLRHQPVQLPTRCSLQISSSNSNKFSQVTCLQAPAANTLSVLLQVTTLISRRLSATAVVCCCHTHVARKACSARYVT
jgi:hypothetical protein